MSEPNWTKVLEYLYNKEEAISYDNENPIEDLDVIDNLECVTEDNFSDTISYMKELDLVEFTTTQNQDFVTKKYRLTKTGLEIAHEREITNSQQETNRSSARLSGYLVVAIILQSLISITQLEGGWEVVLLSLIILGLVFVVFIELVGDSIESQIESLRSLF